MKMTGSVDARKRLRIVEDVARRAPRAAYEEVRTAVLVHSVNLPAEMNDGMLFVSLKNKATDVVRRHLVKEDGIARYMTMRHEQEEDVELDEHGDGYLYAVATVLSSSTEAEKRLLIRIMRDFIEQEQPTVRRSIKSLGISSQRGYVLLCKLRTKLRSALRRFINGDVSRMPTQKSLREFILSVEQG